MTDYVWSDPHFGHQNILKFEPSRLALGKDIEEHDMALINLYNETVGYNDKCYILGDFCFKLKHLFKAGMLNGTKYLILGNHDLYGDTRAEYLNYFADIYGVLGYKRHAIMSHIPVHKSQQGRYRFNLHGHVHSNSLDDPFYINCSVEVCPWFKPMCLEELLESKNAVND